MDFGLFMMPLHPPRRSFADSYDRDTAQLVQADQLGYHEAWIGEHITETWENAPVPELLIAKALALTEHIIFATGVTMLPLHHPVDTAHRIAMLDHIARGRFYWGIGVRSLPTDLHLYGVDYTSMDEVRERGKEALEVILGLWQAEDGHFGFEGKYYKVHAPEIDPQLGRRLYYQPYQKPHPPIGVAASTPHSDTIRLAGERGWIPMTNLMAQHVRTLWEKVEEGAASTGKEADRQQLRIGREVYVGETPSSARKEARMVLGRPFDEHQYRNRKAQGNLRYVKLDPAMPDEAVDVDYMMEHVWIVGDPQGVRRQNSPAARGGRGLWASARHHPGPGRPYLDAAFPATPDGRGGSKGAGSGVTPCTLLAAASPDEPVYRMALSSVCCNETDSVAKFDFGAKSKNWVLGVQ